MLSIGWLIMVMVMTKKGWVSQTLLTGNIGIEGASFADIRVMIPTSEGLISKECRSKVKFGIDARTPF